MKHIFLVAAFLFSHALGGVEALAQDSTVSGTACVGYRAKKTMFLVKKVDIEGRSCEVRLTSIVKGDVFDLTVEFPIKSLKSGDSRRDDDVADRLGWAEHPEIKIDFLGVERTAVLNLKAGEALRLKGNLRLRGRTVEVQPQLSFDSEGKKYSGEIQTKYETFGLKVPTVAGGLVSKAEPTLILFFELDEVLVQSRLAQAQPVESGTKP